MQCLLTLAMLPALLGLRVTERVCCGGRVHRFGVEVSAAAGCCHSEPGKAQGAAVGGCHAWQSDHCLVTSPDMLQRVRPCVPCIAAAVCPAAGLAVCRRVPVPMPECRRLWLPWGPPRHGWQSFSGVFLC